jgi:NAD(P)-dependent dehydrogenase (short-subunit alcohol dehydrogenase family)
MDVRFDFTNKTVVVFGGTTGINLAIAEAFAGAGARVAVASRKPDNVDAAVARITQSGGDARGFIADVRDFESVAAAFAGVRAEWGTVDVLVSGAAGNFLAEVNSLSPNGFKVVVDIDLIGTFNVMRAGFEHLASGASVLNITAPQATIPMRYQAHVCAAKAGVDQLTRVLALEWGSRNIRVNAIAPGPISGTEGLERLTPTDDPGGDTAMMSVPLGRLGTKQDIASLAMFLSSSAASYISGAVIPCDGGGAIDSVKSGIEQAGDPWPPHRRQTRERAPGGRGTALGRTTGGLSRPHVPRAPPQWFTNPKTRTQSGNRITDRSWCHGQG